jgi:hypothetical protein
LHPPDFLFLSSSFLLLLLLLLLQLSMPYLWHFVYRHLLLLL